MGTPLDLISGMLGNLVPVPGNRISGGVIHIGNGCINCTYSGFQNPKHRSRLIRIFSCRPLDSRTGAGCNRFAQRIIAQPDNGQSLKRIAVPDLSRINGNGDRNDANAESPAKHIILSRVSAGENRSIDITASNRNGKTTCQPGDINSGILIFIQLL